MLVNLLFHLFIIFVAVYMSFEIFPFEVRSFDYRISPQRTPYNRFAKKTQFVLPDK